MTNEKNSIADNRRFFFRVIPTFSQAKEMRLVTVTVTSEPHLKCIRQALLLESVYPHQECLVFSRCRFYPMVFLLILSVSIRPSLNSGARPGREWPRCPKFINGDSVDGLRAERAALTFCRQGTRSLPKKVTGILFHSSINNIESAIPRSRHKPQTL